MSDCEKCDKPIAGAGIIVDGSTYHRECKPRRPWVRPPGCECNIFEPRGSKCSAQWMRCNARIAYATKRETAARGDR